MSDALNYLLKARPDALGHYFAFLKDAGKHLDPKTKNLISVITKVHAQTDRGLRQYLRRALREGCTPVEVLDALLMAFPALGLAKIIWAVDVILDMKLPEFQDESVFAQVPVSTAGAASPASTSTARWHDVMASTEAKDGQVQRTECDGFGLFIYREKKSFSVFDSRCPHQSTDIPELALKGATLTCPKHHWEFDAKSGDCIKKGNSPLKRIESKVVKGRLLAFW
jgi:nitrite reductase/ring-hydroxylating ferredoxin subunit/alkylhydroperoxidase/carboxymuconolactone decarboxylase family protein YurZ